MNIGLTKGLIAQRVLLVKQDTQYIFNDIHSKQDIKDKNLVGAFDEGWFDKDIWRNNNLAYSEFLGDRKKIYTMLASGKRNIDYFSSGVNKIISDVNLYPKLSIEQNLLFCYQSDAYFYVTGALQSGLLDKLIEKYWGNLKQKLQLDKRVKIALDLPK